MKTVIKNKFESDLSYFENILKVFKSDSEVRFLKKDLDIFLHWIEIKKIGEFYFTILYNSNANEVVIMATLIDNRKKEKTKDLTFEFKDFYEVCNTVGCIFNLYHNNKYNCTKEYKYENCINKTTNLLKSDL